MKVLHLLFGYVITVGFLILFAFLPVFGMTGGGLYLIWRLSVATPGVRAASRRCLRCRGGGGSDWRSGRRRPRGNEGGSSREKLLLNKLQHLTAPAAPCSPRPTRASNSREAASGYGATEVLLAALLLRTTPQFVRSWTCGSGC